MHINCQNTKQKNNLLLIGNQMIIVQIIAFLNISIFRYTIHIHFPMLFILRIQRTGEGENVPEMEILGHFIANRTAKIWRPFENGF